MRDLPEDITTELLRIMQDTCRVRARIQRVAGCKDRSITKARAKKLEDIIEQANAMVRAMQYLAINPK